MTDKLQNYDIQSIITYKICSKMFSIIILFQKGLKRRHQKENFDSQNDQFYSTWRIKINILLTHLTFSSMVWSMTNPRLNSTENSRWVELDQPHCSRMCMMTSSCQFNKISYTTITVATRIIYLLKQHMTMLWKKNKNLQWR